jgi:uncharacterized membrane protein YccC
MAKIKPTPTTMTNNQPISPQWILRLAVLLIIILALAAGYYFDLSKLFV